MQKSKKINIIFICLFSIFFISLSILNAYTIKAETNKSTLQSNGTTKGIEWEKEFSKIISKTESVAYNNKDTYVAIVDETLEEGYECTWHGGQNDFYPASGQSEIYTNKNGGKWTKINVNNFGGKVIWAGNLFVSIDTFYDTVKYTSADGLKWETPSPKLGNIKSLVFFNGNYYGINDSGNIISSSDFKSWTTQKATDSTLTQIINTKDGLFAIGSKGTIVKSVNGQSWEKLKFVSTDDLYQIVYANKNYVVRTSTNKIFYSVDCTTWNADTSLSLFNLFMPYDNPDISQQNLGTLLGAYPNQFKCMTYFKNFYIASGDNGIYKASISDMNWHRQNVDIAYAKNLTDIIYANNEIVGIGNRKVAVSADSKTWQSYDLDLPNRSDINSIAYGLGKFIAAGTNGTLISSVDGIKWELIDSSYLTSENINKVIWGGNNFVAIGNNGLILTSDNAFIWNKQVTSTNSDFKDIIWDGTKYIVLGNDGVLLTSNNGSVWAKKSQDILSETNSISFCNGLYIGVGQNGCVLTSTDCKNWTKKELDTVDINDVKGDNGFRAHTLADIDPTENLIKVISDGQRFLTFGNQGNLFIGKIKSTPINETGDAYRKFELNKYTLSNKETPVIINDAVSNGTQLLLKCSNEILSSLDNKNYNNLGDCIYGDFEGLIYNGKYFITFCELKDDFESGEILISKDGAKWVRGNSNFSSVHPSSGNYNFNRNFDKIKYNGQEFLIKEGKISYVSKDGLTWSKRASSSIDNIKNITTLGRFKIKVTDDGKLWLLKTNNKWTQLKTKNNVLINSLTSNGNTCIVVGKKGYIGLIDNKGLLSNVKSNVGYDITKVLWAKNEFIAIDSNGYLLVSTDGKIWAPKWLTK